MAGDHVHIHVHMHVHVIVPTRLLGNASRKSTTGMNMVPVLRNKILLTVVVQPGASRSEQLHS
eukprot:4869477-Pleurochrysis_carterae.AAC.1